MPGIQEAGPLSASRLRISFVQIEMCIEVKDIRHVASGARLGRG